MDDGNVDAGKYGNGNYYCENCAIKEYHHADPYQPPACFNVNTSISVMEGELLPFRWNLELNDAKLSDDSGRTCEPGTINEDTLTCDFALYNGKTNSQADSNPLYRKTGVDCLHAMDDDRLWKSFEAKGKDFYPSLFMNDAPGRYYFKMKDGQTFDDNNYGEYKLVLERVKYDYCEEYESEEENEEGGIDYETKTRRSDGILIDRVCEVNYAVTKPYLMQKSAFGALKVDEDVDLSKFYDIE